MSINARIRLISDDRQARAELEAVGADGDSLAIMAPKAVHHVIKLDAVDVRAANILKQQMLSAGGEAAVAKWASAFTQPTTDVLLMGTARQYRRVLTRLRVQPFGLKAIGAEVAALLDNLELGIRQIPCGKFELEIGRRTLIMGILNVTPDSFSENGLFKALDDAVKHGMEMAASGADIIDIGGESSRPGADPVSADEELARIIPVVKQLAGKLSIPISIDTTKARVAEEALKAGAAIVNDITALQVDTAMARVVADQQAPVILMHMKGEPRTMQDSPEYGDLMGEIIAHLRQSADIAMAEGVARGSILVDPGFGFGKTVQHNLELLRCLPELRSLGFPIVVGTSRKSTIGRVLDLPVDKRLEGTAATVAATILGGADIVRVHDVRAMALVARMTDAVKMGINWHG